MRNKLLFCAVVLLFCTPVFSASLYDSLSWFPDGKLAYARFVRTGLTTEYTFHDNGHVSSITRLTIGNRLSSRYEFYPTGHKKFDTVCSPDYYNWSWRYYPDGSKKKFIQEQFTSSYQSSHTRFEIIDWDENGEISHVLVKDEDNKVVADESYPFRQFRGMKKHQQFFPDGSLSEHGFYVTDSLTGKKKKYGAWVSFHANGQVKTAGLFMNDLPWGLHYIFTDEGTQLSLKNYEQGIETGLAEGKLVQTTGISPGMDWVWNHFTREGLLIFKSNGQEQVSFYYRGVSIVDITELKKSTGQNRTMGFAFPYMPYWSTWSNYVVRYEGYQLISETESVNGSWHNSRKYNRAGVVIAENTGAREEEITNYANGKNAHSEKPMYFNYERNDHVKVLTPRRDTAFSWDANGKLLSIEVHGIYGQEMFSCFYHANRPDSVVKNMQYTRVFVEVTPGKTIEILDGDVNLPGEYTLINMEDVVVARYHSDVLKNGLWIEYDPVTGKKLVSQYYHNGKPHGPGKYKEFYSNGNPKQTGTYGAGEQMVGVWKTYTPKGRLVSRYRYKNGEARGIAFCRACCPNKHNRYRYKVTIHLKGSRTLSFPRCFRPPIDYD